MKIYFISDNVPTCSRTLQKPMVTAKWIFVIICLCFVVAYLNLTNSLVRVSRISNPGVSSPVKSFRPAIGNQSMQHIPNDTTGMKASLILVKPSLNNSMEKDNSSVFVDTDLKQSEVASGKLKISQDDPRLLKYLKTRHLTPPPTSGSADFSSSTGVNYTEQQEIFRYVIQALGNKTEGFFIECGANDGEYFSNTVQLERDYQWTGLLIEPDPRPFPQLIKRNRKAWLADVCLSTDEAPKQIEMMASQHQLLTFVQGFKPFGSATGFKAFKAQCFPLYSILKAIEVTDVDYFSLDIEGAELAVLKTIPWNSVFIKVISVEVHPSYVKPVRDYMTAVGYKYLTFIQNQYSHDQIYIHPNATLPTLV